MLKELSIGLLFAGLLAAGPAFAEQRRCSTEEVAKKVEECGGYIVWINPSKKDCSYGFRGDHLFCGTQAGYLACEQEAQRLRCQRPISNR